jgi:hypothetical protein
MHINCVVRTNFNPAAPACFAANRSRYIRLGYVCGGARWVRIEHAQYDSVRKTVQLKRDFYPSNPFTRLGRLSQSDRA